MKTSLTLAGSVIALELAGCGVSSDPNTVVVTRQGLLTVTWTVDGTTDPNACAVEGADAIDVVVQTPAGSIVAEATDACETSATSVELPSGHFDASAALLDRAGHTITTRVDLGPVTLRGDDEVVVDADFPPDSFY